MKSNRTTWMLRHKIVATHVLSAAGVAGFSAAASAAPAPAAAVAAGPAVMAFPASTVAASGAATPIPTGGDDRMPVGTVVPSDRPGDSRVSIKPLIDAAVKIIKAIPGWWSKFSAGVKKAWAWFNTNVWKPLVKIANALSVLVTGWEIWSWFH